MQELEDLAIPRNCVSPILTEDLGTERVEAKLVPRLLSQDQKEFRAETAQDLLDTRYQ